MHVLTGSIFSEIRSHRPRSLEKMQSNFDGYAYLV